MTDLLGVGAEWLRTGRGEIVETDRPAERIWLPLADNYQDQLKDLAKLLEDFAAQMTVEAKKLKKQAEDFDDYAKWKAASTKATEQMRRAEKAKLVG